MIDCQNCATMKVSLTLIGNVLERILPAGEAKDKLLALCRNARQESSGDFLLKRSEAAEKVCEEVIASIRSTGPFKITPSRALNDALMRWVKMTDVSDER